MHAGLLTCLELPWSQRLQSSHASKHTSNISVLEVEANLRMLIVCALHSHHLQLLAPAREAAFVINKAKLGQ